MMFDRDEPSKQKGKKTTGFATRKDGQFSLGWDVSNQMNSYQAKKNKDQHLTTKVTENQKSQEAPTLTFDEKCRQLIEENPDITSEELHERMALWELNSNKQPVIANSKPVSQHTSSKGGIFGGEEPQNQLPASKRGSRRNQATFSFGEYNYFKEDNRK